MPPKYKKVGTMDAAPDTPKLHIDLVSPLPAVVNLDLALLHDRVDIQMMRWNKIHST